MSAGTPFDLLSIAPNPDQVENEVDPEFRTPAFRLPGADLEDEPLGLSERDILSLLSGYFDEAETTRETGFEARHDIWEENLNAFWMRKDFSGKQSWQSKEVSAAVPNFVERFSAKHRLELTQRPEWADITDTRDPHGVLSSFATRFARQLLDFAGTNSSGHPVQFEHIFGNVLQVGALMKCNVAVLFDARTGRVVVEQVDPRQCYFDPTGRGLYRVRFWEEDKETLLRKAEQVDANGDPLWNSDAIEQLVAHHDRAVQENKEDSSGQGDAQTSNRTPILIKEWLVDLVDTGEGKKVREKQLIVVANDQFIIRGPEPNPFWHGKDWVLGHPVLNAPMSPVDGRTYVELFRHAVETHENVTNRVLDILAMQMNAFEVDPGVLDDPDVLKDGISPNMVLLRDMDAAPGDKAIQSVEMGRPISQDLMNVWRATKQESQESASLSDLSLGNTVQSGETTATEVQAASQGGSELSSSISTDLDIGLLGPLVELVYYTGLQHVTVEGSPAIINSMPDEDVEMLEARREDFRGRPIMVRAKGLTQSVERGRRLRGLLGAVNVIAGNPLLVSEFRREYSLSKLVKVLLEDFSVEIDRIELTQEEKLRQIEAEVRARFAQGGQPGATQTANNQGGTDPLSQGAGVSGEVQ